MKMKRTLLIGLLLILLCSWEAHAQGQFRKPLKSTNQSILGFSNYNIGLKLGCPWSYMPKSSLHKTAYDGHFGYLIGITGERNLGKWSVALEATLAQKGTKMHNERPYQISLSQNGILRTQYEVAYNVVTVRIPVTYYFKGIIKDDWIVPYVFAGPEVDIPMGFNLNLWPFGINSPATAITRQYDGPEGTDPVILDHDPNSDDPYTLKTTFSPGINVSVAAGIGLMTKIRFENSAILFKLDAAYNRGIWNLAVPTKEGWKWLFEKQENSIFAHDVEVNFSVVFPIKKILRDACYNFR